MHCDYRNCPRHHNAFHRADHFRDHLRVQHREDLLKRGPGGEVDAAWWRERLPAAVYNGWWRCSKCFDRVSVEEHDWQCPNCANSCEHERQAARRLPRNCDYAGCGAGRPGGEFKSPARFREHLRTVHAEDLPKDKNKAGLAELQSEQWWASRYVASASWRCTRCLDWVDHGRYGWKCSKCGFECEERRRAYRAAALGA
jgi:rubrerythrin